MKDSTDSATTQVAFDKSHSYHREIVGLLGKKQGAIAAATVLATLATWLPAAKKNYKYLWDGKPWLNFTLAELSLQLPYIPRRTIHNALVRLAKHKLIEYDTSGEKNHLQYDFTGRYHIPPKTLKLLKGVCNTFNVGDAVRTESIPIAAILHNFKYQLLNIPSKVVDDLGRKYWPLPPTVLSASLCFSEDTAERGLKVLVERKILIKHPALCHYYALLRSFPQDGTAPHQDKQNFPQDGTAFPQDGTTILDINKDNNVEYSTTHPAYAACVVSDTCFNDGWFIGESLSTGARVLNQSAIDSLAKVRELVKSGKPLIDKSNLHNDPDLIIDDSGELEDYQPINIKQRLKTIKREIRELVKAYQWLFKVDKQGLDALAKFYAANPHVGESFIIDLVQGCRLIQQEQPNAPDSGLMAGNVFKQARSQVYKFDAYRWLKQCHNLTFLLEHLGQIMEQWFFYRSKDANYHYFQSDTLPIIYEWKPRARQFPKVVLERSQMPLEPLLAA